MSDLEETVIRPVAQVIEYVLQNLWGSKDTRSVTYADMYALLPARPDITHQMLGSHYHCGRALAFAKDRGLITYDGELSLFANEYQAEPDLLLEPGPRSNWREIERIVDQDAELV